MQSDYRASSTKTPFIRTAALFNGLLFVFLVAGASAVLAESRDPVKLQRATLTVHSVDESIAFYRDLLGFTVRSRSAYDTPALRKMFDIPASATPELVLLDAGQQQPRALALVGGEGLRTDREANRQSAPALLFNTSQMDAIHEAMKNAGVEVLLPPTPLTDFSGKPFGREAAYLDPDGVRVILFENN